MGRSRHKRLAAFDHDVDERNGEEDRDEADGKTPHPAVFDNGSEPHQCGERHERPQRIAPHGDDETPQRGGNQRRHQERTKCQPSDVAPIEPRVAGDRLGDRLAMRAGAGGEERDEAGRRQQIERLAANPLQRKRQILAPANRDLRARVDVVKRQEVVRREPPEIGCDHDREGGRHQIGTGGAPRPPCRRIGDREHAKRRRQREGRIFRPERASKKSARQQPVEPATVLERTIKEPARERPERQLHLVVREFHGRKIVVVHALEREHRDQAGQSAGRFPRQPPNRIKANGDRKRAEHVDRVDLAGQPVGDVGRPPWQRRVLPITELPFLAERKVLDEIKLKVRADPGAG